MFVRIVDKVTWWLGSPVATLLAVALVVVWLAGLPYFGPTDTYQLIINTTTTIVTFIMVFVVQATQNRDSKAVHAKLDGIVAASADADDTLEHIEKLSEPEIDAIHQQVTE